jgi:hypothetical protein
MKGLVRQGSLSQKAAMFEKEIADHKKSQEKPEKKVVWGMLRFLSILQTLLSRYLHH